MVVLGLVDEHLGDAEVRDRKEKLIHKRITIYVVGVLQMDINGFMVETEKPVLWCLAVNAWSLGSGECVRGKTEVNGNSNVDDACNSEFVTNAEDSGVTDTDDYCDCATEGSMKSDEACRRRDVGWHR